MIELQPRHYAALRGIKSKLLGQSSVWLPLSRRDKELLAWCEQWALLADHDLGWPREKRFCWSEQLLLRVERLLVQQGLLGIDRLPELRDQPRAAQLRLGSQEFKGLGLKPRQTHFLARLAEPPASGLASVLSLDCLSDLQLQAPWVLVENYDCFIEMRRSQLPAALASAHLVYRGDGFGSEGCKALRYALAQRQSSLWYFGDFDPKGLELALSLGCCGLLLPAPSALIAMLSCHQFPLEQLAVFEQLSAKADAPLLLSAALGWLSASGAALQQNFQSDLHTYRWHENLSL